MCVCVRARARAPAHMLICHNEKNVPDRWLARDTSDTCKQSAQKKKQEVHKKETRKTAALMFHGLFTTILTEKRVHLRVWDVHVCVRVCVCVCVCVYHGGT